MVSISLLGIPNDENTSYLRGSAEAPPLIRRELLSDVYSSWSESGFDFSAAGALVDHGDIEFDSTVDSWGSHRARGRTSIGVRAPAHLLGR